MSTDAFSPRGGVGARFLSSSAVAAGVGSGTFGPPRDNTFPLRELCLENGKETA